MVDLEALKHRSVVLWGDLCAEISGQVIRDDERDKPTISRVYMDILNLTTGLSLWVLMYSCKNQIAALPRKNNFTTASSIWIWISSPVSRM